MLQSFGLKVTSTPCLAGVSEVPAEERDHAASHPFILECLHAWSVPLIDEGFLARAAHFVASDLVFSIRWLLQTSLRTAISLCWIP
jgi:hypothetical protein